ncbi:lipase family protein [Nocardia sp. NBC_00565]|uniref:lipase family protein n=1 Tax=Nocardia sp. NBC_00565 TaxID=2975993 RepID=UPI002E805757|nr:lipase family protein [Nocardia sp. NBC_00565]WUC07886.1 lipase family protein [Nocardia sp. NBC_00565]
MSRSPWRSISVAIALALTVIAASTLVATADADYTGFDPDPTGDAYLDQHFSTDGLANGAILSSRSVRILPPLAVTSDFDAWQVWFKSTAADGKSIAAITTIMKPKTWNGRVVGNNYAIDSIGLQCNPSYQLTHSLSIEAPDITRQLLGQGYAVVITDYQGPKMAYAHGPTQAREVLDGIRAALQFPAAGLAGSPLAMIGYSGGAIATVWAAQLQPTYAPELRMLGAAAGGTPADLSLLRKTMDGRPPASVLYLMAALGVARVTPGALDLLNETGVRTAREGKNLCSDAAVLGVAPVPLRSLTKVDPYQAEVTQRIYRETKAGGLTPTMPIYLWHGVFDVWVPAAGAQALQQQWQSAGAEVSLSLLPCDHITCAFTPGAIDRIDQWMGIA